MAASESVATKTALAALATAALGGVGGQYALILVGAFGGAALSLAMREPMQRWWQPLTHIGAGVTAGVLFTGLAAHGATALAPASWGLSEDLLWMPLAAIVAAGWRQVPALAMAYANRKIGGGTTGS
jgi:hypothetical protein